MWLELSLARYTVIGDCRCALISSISAHSWFLISDLLVRHDAASYGYVQHPRCVVIFSGIRSSLLTVCYRAHMAPTTDPLFTGRHLLQDDIFYRTTPFTGRSLILQRFNDTLLHLSNTISPCISTSQFPGANDSTAVTTAAQ